MTRFFLTETYEKHADALPAVQGMTLHSELNNVHPLRIPAPGKAKSDALTLQLGTRFAALDAGGEPIRLSQKKGRLMLAMLACAPGMKRSRDWLRRHLWHRSFTSHGFSSLRQCLHNLRHALGPHGDSLRADRDFIWLENIQIDWDKNFDDPAQFLEDTPRLQGPAQEWLDRQRARLSGSTTNSAV